MAEAIAARIPADLVSADAMQVYRDLPLLTNQSTHPTQLVGIWDLEHEASVGEYAPLAHAAIDRILGSERTPVVVGGTGLYLRAALAELSLPPAPGAGARERWGALYDAAGPDAAHQRLRGLDPAAARAVHANDRRRVVRALELAEAGASLARGQDRLWAEETRHPTVIVGLDVPKDVIEAGVPEAIEWLKSLLKPAPPKKDAPPPVKQSSPSVLEGKDAIKQSKQQYQQRLDEIDELERK